MARCCAFLAFVILLAGCGGGSSAGPAADATAGLRPVEERHANGQLAAKGTVLDEAGVSRRHGSWRTWHVNGQLHWAGEYRHDAVDQARPWREWNADGSIRDDADDGG